jgi:biopolymer transport protein TolR
VPERNRLRAERVVRPDVPRAHAAIGVAPFGAVLMTMVALMAATQVHLEQRGLEVALPAVAPASFDASMSQVVIEITADRAITLNDATVSLAELEGTLRHILASRRDKAVYVIGAGSLRYGDVVPLIDAAHGAGARHVGIVTTHMIEISRGQYTRPSGR